MITANRQSIEMPWWRRFTPAAPLFCHRQRHLPPWRFTWRNLTVNGVSCVIAEVGAMECNPMATARLIGRQEATVTSQLHLAGLLKEQGQDQSSTDLWKPRGGWDGAAYECSVPGTFGIVNSPGAQQPLRRATGAPTQETLASTAIAPGPARSVVGQVRGVLAERVIISTALDPFLSLRALAGYSGISVRKLHEYLADPINPLPHYRVGGKILVRRSEFDAWIVRYRQCGRADVDSIVVSVISDLGQSKALTAA